MRDYLIVFAVLVLHAVSVSLAPEIGMALSYFFFGAFGVAAGAAAIHRGLTSGRRPDVRWLALALTMALWLCGVALSARQSYVLDNANPAPGDSMFFYIIYVVPALVTLSSSPVATRKRWALGIDLVLACMLAALFYARVFALVTMEGAAGRPEAEAIATMLDIENIFLAVAAIVRLLAAERQRDAVFYRAVSVFFVSYTILVGYYNHFVALGDYPDFGSAWDILLDIPFAAWLLAARRGDGHGRVRWRPPVFLVRFVQSASPVFMALGVLCLGLMVMDDHPELGVTACAAAVLGIGLRSTLTQVSLVEVESRLTARQATLEGLAYRDSLTELANRRALDATLLTEWHRTVERNEPVALLMIDIDFFKQFNDRYGHLEGDECLRRVASALATRIGRGEDFLARYGGEEFAVVAPTTTLAGAHQLAQSLRDTVQSMGIRNDGSPYGIVTVSIGVAVGMESPDAGPLSLLQAADSALYRAKAGGRNAVASAA